MLDKMDCYGMTNTGLVRKSNQDQYLIADLYRTMDIRHTSLPAKEQTTLAGGHRGSLLAVADGMGGHAGGERASLLAIDALRHYLLNCTHWFLRLHDDPEDDLLDELKTLFEYAQRRIHADSKESLERRRMGTTLTLGYVIWPRLYLVHAGDSRAYLYRHGEMHRLTQDHTAAQRLADAGVLKEGERAGSRLNHVLWNFLGPGVEDLTPEAHRVQLQEDDSLLLCTDGLTKHMSDEELAEAFELKVNAQELCKSLVDLTLERGARDNVTVIVARSFAPVSEAVSGDDDDCEV